MVTQKEIRRTIEVAFDTEIKDWWIITTVNEMLRQAGVKAKFDTQQQNIYFEGKEGEILTLVVGDEK